MKPHLFRAICNDKSVSSIRLTVTIDTGQEMYCWPWSRKGKNFIGAPFVGFPSGWADEDVAICGVELTLDEYRALRRYRRQTVMARRAARRAQRES